MVVSDILRTFASTESFRPATDRIKTGAVLMYYVLRNEEWGCICDCPTFDNRQDAENEADGKCRRHSVVETNRADPCRPMKPIDQCRRCPRWVKYKAR